MKSTANLTSIATLQPERHILDGAFDALVQDTDGENVAPVMDRLSAELSVLRSSLPSGEWRTVAKEFAPRHPLAHLLHQDPFSRRGFYKPRGYAGDAKLLVHLSIPG